MSDSDVKKLRAFLREEIKPLKEELEIIKHKVGLVSSQQTVDSLRIEKIKDQVSVMNEKLDSHTESLVKIEAALEGYADMYKVNKEDNQRLKQRLERIENQLAITPQG